MGGGGARGSEVVRVWRGLNEGWKLPLAGVARFDYSTPIGAEGSGASSSEGSLGVHPELRGTWGDGANTRHEMQKCGVPYYPYARARASRSGDSGSGGCARLLRIHSSNS